jgi:hypothetical protein
MAGFMRKIAGYDEGGSVTSNPDDDTEDGTGALKDADFPVKPNKLNLPFTRDQLLSGMMGARTKLADYRSDKSEKWLAIAAALGQPTRTGTIGETASNVAGAVGKYKAEQRAEEQKNLADRLGIDTKIFDIMSDEEKAQGVYDSKTAALKAKYGLPVQGSIHYDTANGQTLVSYLTNSGFGVQFNINNPSDFKVTKAPDIPGAPPLQAAANNKTPPPQPTTLQKVGGVNAPAQQPSPLQVAANGPPPVAPLVTPPIKTEKPTFVGQDGKRHAVGDPPYEGSDGYMYRMGERGVEVKASEQPSEASKARQTRTTAQVTSEAAASKPAPADHTAFNAERTAIKSLDQSAGSIKRALEVNDLAFDGPLGGLATGAARLTGRNEAELKATAVMSAALNEATLGNLKASLGANPNEGERKYLDDMFAAAKSAATKAERAAKLAEIQTWITNRRAGASDTVKAYQQQFPSYFDPNYIDAVKQARSAIAKGAPRDAVIQRLKEQGLAPPGDL